MIKFRRIILTVPFFFLSWMGFGQSNVVSGGCSVSVTGGSISYTVGQIDYKSTTDSSGQLNEGVQQPWEIYTLSVEEYNDTAGLYTIYPNPVSSSFQLQIADLSSEVYVATLYSLEGKVIFNITVYTGSQEISLEGLPEGIYLLNLYKNDSVVKMFKIIKKPILYP